MGKQQRSRKPAPEAGRSAPTEQPATTGPPTVRWRDAPQQHDYPAAAAYLSLLAGPAAVAATVAALGRAETTTHAAKDILRAAGLPLLGADNPHVRSDLHKIARTEALSPVLLVRGDAAAGVPLQIADGYHRVCASYHTDENTPIPARLVRLGADGQPE